jgi:hypothetical protein
LYLQTNKTNFVQFDFHRETMKFFTFILLLNFAAFAICSETSFIASAISQLIANVFADTKEGFDLIVVKNSTKHEKFNRIIDQVGKKTDAFHIPRKISVNKPNLVNRSTILFHDSWASYKYYIIGNVFKTKMYVLTVVDEPMKDLNHSTFRHRGSTKFLLENFLIFSDPEVISLKTFQTFQQPDCKTFQEIEVNQFSRSTQKWKHGNFSLKKFENFNGCQMVVLAVYPQNFAVMVDTNKRKDRPRIPLKVTGYAAVFNDVISQNLNYTYIYNAKEKGPRTDYFNSSLYVNFPLEVSSNRRMLMQHVNESVYYVTDSFTVADEIVLIPQTKPYSMLQKVFLPFEPELWYWLIGSLGVLTLVSIIVVYFTTTTVRRFVFGTRVRTPIMNMM